MSLNSLWYIGKVEKGNQLGRHIGFPTINLNPNILPSTTIEGVYACLVKYDNKIYKGALYFGPRKILKENNRVLEINIFDFNQLIYGKTIQFQLKQFIRGVIAFNSLDSLEKQIQKDIEEIKKL